MKIRHYENISTFNVNIKRRTVEQKLIAQTKITNISKFKEHNKTKLRNKYEKKKKLKSNYCIIHCSKHKSTYKT